MTTSLWRDAIIGGVIAAILNGIIFFVGESNYGISFLVSLDGNSEMEVSLIFVVALTFVAALLGGLILWIVIRLPRGDRLFMWLAFLFTLISFVPTYMMSRDLPTMIMLSLMHVVAALTILWWLVIRNPVIFERPKPGSTPIAGRS